MADERQNCWEFQKCGKQTSCPAYPDQGRICFSVKGTHCRGEIQGGFVEKINKCKSTCNFYRTLDTI